MHYITVQVHSRITCCKVFHGTRCTVFWLSTVLLFYSHHMYSVISGQVLLQAVIC
jgi:hypothetical protein